MAVSLIGGTACIVRSLSREKARSDRLKELDERNRANLQRAKSMALDLISWGGLAAALMLWDRGTADLLFMLLWGCFSPVPLDSPRSRWRGCIWTGIRNHERNCNEDLS